ncbi:MAG TPA: hypothetical protein VM219_02090 [Phycisphaerae bacterium]|nr:hypothetical protein [Phycisphaerae bacterium]
MWKKRNRLFIALGVLGLCMLGCLAWRTRDVPDLYDRLTLRVAICTVWVTVLGGLAALVKWWDEIEERTRKNKFELLSLLQDRLQAQKFRAKRKNVVQFWQSFLTGLEKIRDGQRFPECAKTKEEFENALGINITIPDQKPADNAMWAASEEVCNEFEYIGGLVETKVISHKEIETFFQTMPADTFVRLLPFILYKRAKKASYAHHFQKLARVVGTLSTDVG